jgi:hypothetical protein
MAESSYFKRYTSSFRRNAVARPRRIVRNEPNFRYRRVGRGRRGMAHAANVRNKANFGRRRVGQGLRDKAEGRCTNKPNFRQTRYPTIPLFYYSSIPIRCRWRETKPLW